MKQVDAPSTVDRSGKRKWLYPVRLSGPRVSRRRLLAFFLILFYFAVPWMTFNGRPLLRVDILSQKVFFFGLVLKVSEYSYIFFIFIILGLVLFLVTTLKGRIWCGYACPQTVFVEWVIRPIEEFFEGPANRRRTKDTEKWNLNLLGRKGLKQLTFILVAVLVSNALLGFFFDPNLILKWTTSSPANNPGAFIFMSIVASAVYFDLSWFREQFCSFLCPYARFQAIMLDDHSPSVTYQSDRGDPRGKKPGSGDCIDCGLCVRVCPTGIDIRNGLQMECIQCERCIDACDTIMTNLKRPKGLIKVDAPEKISIFRFRVFVYFAMICITFGLVGYKLFERGDISATIIREARGQAYITLPDGRHANLFTVRIVNNTEKPQNLAIQVVRPKTGVKLQCPRCGEKIGAFQEMVTPLFVTFATDQSIHSVTLNVRGSDGEYILPIIDRISK